MSITASEARMHVFRLIEQSTTTARRLRSPCCWSRRISEEHRLVYLVDGDDLVILQDRYDYK